LYEDIMCQIRNARNGLEYDSENTRGILIFMSQLGLNQPEIEKFTDNNWERLTLKGITSLDYYKQIFEE